MINLVALEGRLVRDLELKKTNSGKSVVNFTLAVNRRFQKDEADFIPCVVWDKQAEVMQQYLRKGSLIGIEGRIQQRTYQTNNGENRSVVEVVVNNFSFLESSKQETQQNNYSQPQQAQVKPKQQNNEPEFSITSDDLPF